MRRRMHHMTVCCLLLSSYYCRTLDSVTWQSGVFQFGGVVLDSVVLDCGKEEWD